MPKPQAAFAPPRNQCNAALGAIVGYCREATGSVLPAIIVHALFNIGGTIPGWIMKPGNEAQALAADQEITPLLGFCLAGTLFAQTPQSQNSGNASNNVQIGTARDVNIRQQIGPPKKEISTETLKELNWQISRSYIEDLFGKPKTVRRITKDEVGFATPRLTYCRYGSEQYEVQILYS
jgi:hypothetical protein